MNPWRALLRSIAGRKYFFCRLTESMTEFHWLNLFDLVWLVLCPSLFPFLLPLVFDVFCSALVFVNGDILYCKKIGKWGEAGSRMNNFRSARWEEQTLETINCHNLAGFELFISHGRLSTRTSTLLLPATKYKNAHETYACISLKNYMEVNMISIIKQVHIYNRTNLLWKWLYYLQQCDSDYTISEARLFNNLQIYDIPSNT